MLWTGSGQCFEMPLTSSMTIMKPESALEMGQGLVRRLVAYGGLSAAIALYVYELFERNPAQGFELVRSFGPWFVIVVICQVIAWNALKLLIAYIGKLAQGVQDMAAAVQRISEKDDREAEELKRQTAFNGQQSERILVLLTDQAKQLQVIESKLDHPIQGERL